LPKHCWSEPVEDFRVGKAPTVRVVHSGAAGPSTPLVIDGAEENDDGTRLVYGVDSVHEGIARSCVYWMPPTGLKSPGPYRFSVRSAGGQTQTSEEFFVTR
jgi:hypothetical protein